MRKIYIALAALVLSVMIVVMGSSCGTRQNRYETEFLGLFDAPTRIIGYSENKETFAEDADFIYENMKIYHQLYDIYNNYDFNNIKTINDRAGLESVEVGREIIDLLLLSKEIYEVTDGKVNIALGSVLSIWHDYRKAAIENPSDALLPDMEILREASEHTDIDKIVIDTEKSTVYLDDLEMSLDVGAVAKGYAVEMVARLAEDRGITNLIISAGGNVRAIGGRGNNSGNWKVGVQNPDLFSSRESVVLLSVNNASLVTSGSYERFFTVDGVNYGHIIDPYTLMPANYYKSVTVLIEDSGWGDAYSTALFNMPFDKALAFVEGTDGLEALWIFPDGTIEYSSGMRAFIID